jgi:hypothetical protein
MPCMFHSIVSEEFGRIGGEEEFTFDGREEFEEVFKVLLGIAAIVTHVGIKVWRITIEKSSGSIS